MATHLLAPAIVRRASEIAPPPLWRERLRVLVEQAGQEVSDYRELFELASVELSARESELEGTRVERANLKDRLAESELENAELLGALDDLQRRLAYYRGRLAEADQAAAYVEPQIESFRPQFCSEVVEAARQRLDLVEIDGFVDEHAAELDEHATTESWAQKAWTALQARQSYAVAKRKGFNGDFKTAVVMRTRWSLRGSTRRAGECLRSKGQARSAPA
jgi:chromosome segregation ATPase